jgi:hypothetical protein
VNENKRVIPAGYSGGSSDAVSRFFILKGKETGVITRQGNDIL